MPEMHDKLLVTIAQSYVSALKEMNETGVPVGVDAVCCSITLHTAHGWGAPFVGEIVEISLPLPTGGPPAPPDLPQTSQASHLSG